ncbi:MAG: hypothetical protein KTR31_30615 [Myxococcales bacterium]|nr:hypothetical protein [Myxococcales bacterium]
MAYWDAPLVGTAVAVGVLLAIGSAVRRAVPIPASIVAGLLGLALGPSAMAWLPLDVAVLEAAVYHALALVFIALGLQRPSHGTLTGEARAMGFGITTIVTLQTCVGLALAMLLDVHTGFGLLLPLGFEQGPGQALALGAAWERSGLPQGAQVGLIMAAIGFAWAIGVGVPLTWLGRRLGWTDPLPRRPPPPPALYAALTHPPLTVPLAAMAAVYALTWAVCSGLSALLADVPDVAAMVWGFHFLIGAILAAGARRVLDVLGTADALQDDQLNSVSTTLVDGATVAALAAVQLSVLSRWWGPILVITTVGGLLTLVTCVALALRSFRDAPFAHALVWFGMSTGTLPVGLALLRMVDPELRSPAPQSAVYGSALSIVGVAPVVLGLHPLAITGQPSAALALSMAWLLCVGVLWWATDRAP